MRLLLAALHPPGGARPIGGVQSWCATLAAALTGLGHEVACWGPEWPLPAGRFDAGIFANWSHTAGAWHLCNRGLRVSHGIIPDEALPPWGSRDAFTSEEVRVHWRGTGPVLRQPIDLDFWQPDGAPRQPLLVRFGYYGGLRWLPRLASQLHLDFIHLTDAAAEVARDWLRRAAVVVASGRAALEAMACGAPLVLADERPYQGRLLDLDPVGAMTRNYSGRGGVVATASSLKDAIDQARKRGSLRAHVEQHHDARQIAQEALCLLA